MHTRRALVQRPLDLLYHWTVQQRLLYTADVVAAMTWQEIDDIKRLARPKDLRLIPPGIHTDIYPKCDDARDGEQPIILNIGGDYRNKRLSLLIEAMNYLHDMKLVLIGPDTDKYSDGKNIVGLGMISEGDKMEMLSRANVLCQVSDFEGFGLNILEAMASGVQVVSTPVGVAKDIPNVEIIKSPNPITVASAIRWAINTPIDPIQLRNTASHYDWKVVIQQLEAAMQ